MTSLEKLGSNKRRRGGLHSKALRDISKWPVTCEWGDDVLGNLGTGL